MINENFIEITTRKLKILNYTNSFLLFNTKLDYIPICCLNKILLNSTYLSFNQEKTIVTKYNNILSNLDDVTIFDNLKKSSIFDLYKSTINKENFEFITFENLNSLVKENINNINQINYCLPIFDISNFYKKYSLINNFISTYNLEKIRYKENEFVIGTGFLQKKDDIYVSLMIKKDYIEEFILTRILDKPIDNSKLEWWVNNDIIKQDKSFFNIFLKEIKNSPYNIIAKSGINSIIKQFDDVNFKTIDEYTNFEKDLNNHVLYTMYGDECTLPELKLKTKNEKISNEKLTSIRLPKKEIITQLID